MELVSLAALLGAGAALVTAIASAITVLRYRDRCAALERDRDDARERLRALTRKLSTLQEAAEESGVFKMPPRRRGR